VLGSIQLNNNEIAAALGWTEARSRSMCHHILQKLSAADRTQTVTIGLQRGVIHLA
jgi:DNA-binding NarL/FixJ family response regulator